MKIQFQILLVIIFIVIALRSFAQQNFIRDSAVIRILESHESDSAKIEVLLNYSKTLDGRPVDALMVARLARDFAKKNDFPLFEGRALEDIALYNRVLGNFSEAIEASFNALRIYNHLGLDNLEAAMRLQIGTHFGNDKNYSKAIHYIRQALESFRERRDTSNLVLAQINLGETYRLMGELDSAALFFNECLQLNDAFKSLQVEGYAKGNLGMVYSAQGNDDEAIKLLNASIRELSELRDYYSVSVYQSELAKIYIRRGIINEGEQLFLAALEMAKQEKLKEQIRDISNDLSRFYEQNKRFQKALDLRKQYEVYHDSLANVENIRKTEQLESQYWLDRKDADIKILELKNLNKRRLVIALSAGAFVLLVFLSFLYRLQILRKRAYQKVAEQKDIIEKREREKALLLKELNHRVKNNLQMVSSMFSLQAGQFRGEPAADALIAARRRIDALMLIHQKLYRDDVDTHIKLADYIRELADNLVYGFGKEVDITLELAEARLYIDSAIPLGIIINELLTNSLKYALEGETPSIYIALKEENYKLQLIIADNGPGFPDGDDIKKNRSLGLKLVYSLIRQLHGELTHTNNNGCWWEIILDTDKFQK
jgi:two-component sensor histidine kinase